MSGARKSLSGTSEILSEASLKLLRGHKAETLRLEVEDRRYGMFLLCGFIGHGLLPGRCPKAYTSILGRKAKGLWLLAGQDLAMTKLKIKTNELSEIIMRPMGLDLILNN